MIPKVIYQTYKTKDLPIVLQNNISELKVKNPDFEYKFFDNDGCIEFILEHYSQDILDVYLSINPNYGASRADLFRYLLMYKMGGVYLDIKSNTYLPLNTIIGPKDEYIVSYWIQKWKARYLNNRQGEFQNWHIICLPEHPILYLTIQKVIDNIKNYKGLKGKDASVFTTGPIPYTQAIFKSNSKNIKIYKNEYDLGLIYNNLPTSNHPHDHHKHIGNPYPEDEYLILNYK